MVNLQGMWFGDDLERQENGRVVRDLRFWLIWEGVRVLSNENGEQGSVQVRDGL